MLKDFRRALRWLPNQKRRLALGFLLLAPATALDLAIPLLWRHALDGAIARTLAWTTLILLAALALLLGTLSGGLKYGMRWHLVGASRELERDIRSDLFQKLLTLPARFFGGHPVGDLVSRLTQDIEAVRMAVGPGVMYIGNALLTVTVAFAGMFWIDAPLTLAMAVPLLLLGGVALAMAPRLARESDAVQEGISDISERAAESFAGIRVLKVFTREERQLERMEELGLNYLAAQMRLARARGGMMALLFLVKDLSLFVILLVGGLHVVGGRATIGDFVLFREWMMNCFWPLVTFGWIISMVQRGAAGMKRIGEVLDAPAEIASPAESSAPAPTAASLAVEWRDVSVSLSGQEVLKEISLTVPAGRSLGITGRTGSGKTTLVQLLARLFDPERGSVWVGGIEVRSWDLAQLRRAVGYVPQEAFLFSDTLEENLRFAQPAADQSALAQAVQRAALETDIDAFPQQLATRVGERGVTLSGGQRQRTALARTLLTRPPVVVLDDCLSAIDADTEARILHSLREELLGRTAIVVSHRIAALRELDQIVVLDQGAIVERGTHDELVLRGGLYARLDHDQKLIAELEWL